MKLREVFRYDVELHLRSVSTWAYGAILFLVTLGIFLATSDGVTRSYANSAEEIAGVSVAASMLGMLITAALFGGAGARDVRFQMDPLVYTAPIEKRDYLGGRFLAALAVNAGLLVAVPAGVLAGVEVLARSDSDPLGPFRAAAHAQPYFVFLLPNLVLAGAALFAIGVLARHMVPVYLTAIGLFFAYIAALNYAAGIDSPILRVIVDPLGLTTLQEHTRYWTEIERNTKLIGLPAALAWNRVFWLVASAGVLGALHAAFRFAHPDVGGRRRAPGDAVSVPVPEFRRPVEIPRVARRFDARTTVRQTLAVTRQALTETTASRWFGAVLAACVGLPLLWGWNVGETVFDTSTWPVTSLVVEEVLAGRSLALFIGLVILYAGELTNREREIDSTAMADAAPVSDGVALMGRYLALGTLILMFQAASMTGGLLIQALQGYTRFELGLYLSVVFGLKLADYLILAALAVTIHVLVRRKHLGNVLVLTTLGFVAIGLPGLGFEHHLLLYNTSPGWTYSDMNGFGPYLAPFVWFKLYWGAWALLLLVAATLFRTRGADTGLLHRLRRARARLVGPVAWAAASAALLILALGGFVFYNTNVLNEYRPVAEAGRLRAEYEKRYRQYEQLAQPAITEVGLRVEIFPSERALDLNGTYEMINRGEEPINAVHVFTNPVMEVRSLEIDRGAEAGLVDEDIGYRVYTLDRPLEPGESLQILFDVALRVRGFPNSAIRNEVVANGTYFDRRLLPFIGYQPLFELSDEDARQRFGLDPLISRVPPGQSGALENRYELRAEDGVHVRTVVGTAADQIAITPGVLRRTWNENGRRYFHYETETPAEFGAPVFSADYEVFEDRQAGIDLSVLHHSSHGDNLERTVRGMQAALEYFGEQFGPYSGRHLRIVELPRYGGFGRAHAHTISFTEEFFLSRVREGEVDQPFYGTAHEVAHQWWGGMVRGAIGVRGGGFLSESLANYSAMMVVESTYGSDAARTVYDFHMERYLRGRARFANEVPILEVEGQPYLSYRKGALALYTLRQHIGAEAVNTALRSYFDKYGGASALRPTSLDLYAELRAVTPESQHGLLTDWFETVTLWDIVVERAVVAPTGTGEHEVTLDVVARKLRADRVGDESEVSMDDLVEIGVYAPGAAGDRGEPLHLLRHRLRGGRNTLRITVPGVPALVAVDPHGTLIERARQDNVIEVESEQSTDGLR